MVQDSIMLNLGQKTRQVSLKSLDLRKTTSLKFKNTRTETAN